MKEWTTVRVRRAAYEKLKALADSSGESLGEVCSATVANGADNLAAAGDALVNAVGVTRGIVRGEKLTFDTGVKHANRHANRDNRDDDDDDHDDRDEGDEDDERVTASYRNGDERNSYECNYCLHRWMVGTEPKSPCPECGKELVYPSDNPSEGNEGGMSGGEKALLFGAGVLALIAYSRWQAARQAANGVNNGVM